MAAGRHTHMCFHTLTHAYTNTCTNVQHIVFSKVLINIKTLEPKGNLFTQKHTNTQTCDTYKSAPIRVEFTLSLQATGQRYDVSVGKSGERAYFHSFT